MSIVDPRVRHDRRLRRLRRSARRWSVLGGSLVGAATVLTPYAGIGPADAVWAAAAGGAAALAGWRWIDLRALLAQPPPEPPDPAARAERVRRRVEAFLTGLPGGREALGQVHRARIRGSAVASGWRRLDRASTALDGLAARLDGPGELAVSEAAAAERGLRDLAERIVGVERGMRVGGQGTGGLAEAHAALVAQFEQGVTAYEGLVGAAAAYVAEGGRTTSQHPSVGPLTEATDLLRGVAGGLAELREPDRRTRMPGTPPEPGSGPGGRRVPDERGEAVQDRRQPELEDRVEVELEVGMLSEAGQHREPARRDERQHRLL